MGPKGAVEILFRKEIAESDDPRRRRTRRSPNTRRSSRIPYVAAGRGYVDDIIDPRDTRPRLIDALDDARSASATRIRRRSTGIFRCSADRREVRSMFDARSSSPIAARSRCASSARAASWASRSVAVYSDADARAPHVREADEAVHIGPAPSAESYLRGDRIIEAAKRVGRGGDSSRATASSPSASGSRAPCATPGSSFIGPPPEAIAAMGSKTAARQLAIAAGRAGRARARHESLTRCRRSARRSPSSSATRCCSRRRPAVAGRACASCASRAELAARSTSARREAKNAFGDDAVYVEKYIDGPRHVEIQVLGDQHGTMLSLGERECSVQRRHQKMIEEAPSVAVSPELRRAMGETAVAAARAAGYVNAGTCEFLLDRDGQFYFLEMNTRLQVEHPVTELVTGIDLVQWQTAHRGGRALAVHAGGIVPRGWAIECRITSEDPANGFLPSTGRVSYLHLPDRPRRALGRRHRSRERGRAASTIRCSRSSSCGRRRATRRSSACTARCSSSRSTASRRSRDFHLRVMEDEEFRARRDRDPVARASARRRSWARRRRTTGSRRGDRRRAARAPRSSGRPRRHRTRRRPSTCQRRQRMTRRGRVEAGGATRGRVGDRW